MFIAGEFAASLDHGARAMAEEGALCVVFSPHGEVRETRALLLVL